ncbi:hypothetical protein PUN4_280026 [Paraburkholderia unamae]|nr:hypothetical protein PUN4_280026 [Paraburkholderia unamae]
MYMASPCRIGRQRAFAIVSTVRVDPRGYFAKYRNYFALLYTQRLMACGRESRGDSGFVTIAGAAPGRGASGVSGWMKTSAWQSPRKRASRRPWPRSSTGWRAASSKAACAPATT